MVLGQIGLSFYAVTGGVVQEVLERLDHQVEVRVGPHERMFPNLASGEIDLLVAAWLPGAHGHYWEQYSSEAVELARLYEDARLIWAVPAYVPSSLVRSVEDLLRPEVAARMDQLIQGTGPGSGLMRRSTRMMRDYGLTDAGYRLVPGSQEQWLSSIRSALEAERWAVIPASQPRFLSKAYALRVLEEPKVLLGEGNRAVLVGHRSFSERFPERTVGVLERIELGLEAVAEMDHLVNVEGLEPRQAARRWMETNRARVDSWFAGSQ